MNVRIPTFQFLAGAASLFLLATMAAASGVLATRQGTIESISVLEGVTFLEVSIRSSFSQPSDPELSTGTSDASEIVNPARSMSSMLLGMPVRLIIQRSGAIFTPVVGTVDSVTDRGHCLVKVDATALEQTWKDPSDGNRVHKAGEYLKTGAVVSVTVVAS